MVLLIILFVCVCVCVHAHVSACMHACVCYVYSMLSRILQLNLKYASCLIWHKCSILILLCMLAQFFKVILLRFATFCRKVVCGWSFYLVADMLLFWQVFNWLFDTKGGETCQKLILLS